MIFAQYVRVEWQKGINIAVRNVMKRGKMKPKEIFKLKITVMTPPNKAHIAIKRFGKSMSLVKKPVKKKLINNESFYYIYEVNEKEFNNFIKKKIPKAKHAIRAFYTTIISLANRANKLAKKGAWKVERARRWIMKQLKKKVKDPKEYEDFVNAIDLSDEDFMKDFLAQDLIKWEVLE